MAEAIRTEPGYETRDISVRVVTWFAVGLVASTVVIFLVVIGFYRVLESVHPSPDAPSRIALHPHMIAPPPRLQTNETVDLARYEAAEKAKLNTYGWIDKEAGIIHIPIERAMDLITQGGLPTRGPGTQNASGVTPVQMQAQKAAATKP
jgi:hypothetical protein